MAIARQKGLAPIAEWSKALQLIAYSLLLMTEFLYKNIRKKVTGDFGVVSGFPRLLPLQPSCLY